MANAAMVSYQLKNRSVTINEPYANSSEAIEAQKVIEASLGDNLRFCKVICSSEAQELYDKKYGKNNSNVEESRGGIFPAIILFIFLYMAYKAYN